MVAGAQVGIRSSHGAFDDPLKRVLRLRLRAQQRRQRVVQRARSRASYRSHARLHRSQTRGEPPAEEAAALEGGIELLESVVRRVEGEHEPEHLNS